MFRRMQFLSALLSLFLISISSSQEKPDGDPAEVRSAILNANNITTSIYNYGSIARPNTGGNVFDLVWRRLGYGYEFAPLLAAQVIPSPGDTLRIVDDGLWLASQGDYSPSGLKWGWLPRAGYARAGQPNLATAGNPTSWPQSWSQWPGEYGNGVIMGADEAYYVMDDFTNAEFPYYPFPADSTKRGLGVSTESRVYQFGGGLRDALIIKYKFKNESPRPLNKLYFGFYGDPHIGGPNSFNDDLMGFISRSDTARQFARNTIYSWDFDGRGDGGLPCGYLGFKLLQTPGNRGLTSFRATQWGNSNFPSNDPLFYQWISEDTIDSNQQLFTTPGDNTFVFGSGPFALAPGESTTVALAIFLSEDSLDMINDASYIHFAWRWHNVGENFGQQGGDASYRINLTAPSGVVSGTVPITWQYTGTDPNAKVLVECSSDQGTTWSPIVWNHPVNQSLNWNTAKVRDGVNYSLRIVAHNDALTRFFYDVIDQRFTVNNPMNAQPELRLNVAFEGTTVVNPPLNIGWIAEDADNSNLTITLSYAFNQNGPFTQFHSASSTIGSGSFAWDFSTAPNSNSYFIKVVATDGTRDSSLTTRSFAINQQRGIYHSSVFRRIAGRTTAEFRLQVVNPSQLTRHTYEMAFNVIHPDSIATKRVTVRDLATGAILINNALFTPGISTPVFDGLKLTVNDKATDIDTARSKFNRQSLDSTVNFAWNAFPTLPRTRAPLDWFLAFNSLETDPNGRYLYPGDTVFNQSLRRNVVCPFYFRNIDSAQQGFAVVTGAIGDSIWRSGRAFVIRPQPPTGNQVSYQVNMNFTATARPTFGDTLWIRTHKSITAQDVFRFVADSNYIVSVPSSQFVQSYQLFNNYPNPFNPTTTIRYAIPTDAFVSMRVFNILGQEIATLVNEIQNAGTFDIVWDGRNNFGNQVASGMYLYRIEAMPRDGSQPFISLKKMIFVK